MARRVFFWELKEFTAFIRPIVPIDIRSSDSAEDEEYFLAMCAARRRLCSIRRFLASVSPFYFFSISSFSSFGERGFGNEAAEEAIIKIMGNISMGKNLIF